MLTKAEVDIRGSRIPAITSNGDPSLDPSAQAGADQWI
jgi:hypothetical protein